MHIYFRHNKKFRVASIAFLFVCLASLYTVLEMVCVKIIQKSNLAFKVNCYRFLLSSPSTVLVSLDIKFPHLYIISKSVCYVYNHLSSPVHMLSLPISHPLERSEGAVYVAG